MRVASYTRYSGVHSKIAVIVGNSLFLRWVAQIVKPLLSDSMVTRAYFHTCMNATTKRFVERLRGQPSIAHSDESRRKTGTRNHKINVTTASVKSGEVKLRDSYLDHSIERS